MVAHYTLVAALAAFASISGVAASTKKRKCTIKRTSSVGDLVTTTTTSTPLSITLTASSTSDANPPTSPSSSSPSISLSGSNTVITVTTASASGETTISGSSTTSTASTSGSDVLSNTSTSGISSRSTTVVSTSQTAVTTRSLTSSSTPTSSVTSTASSTTTVSTSSTTSSSQTALTTSSSTASSTISTSTTSAASISSTTIAASSSAISTSSSTASAISAITTEPTSSTTTSAAATSTGCTSPPVGLIQNGDFEAGSSPWTLAGGSFAGDSSKGMTGYMNSAHYWYYRSPRVGLVINAQQVNVHKGLTYKVTLYWALGPVQQFGAGGTCSLSILANGNFEGDEAKLKSAAGTVGVWNRLEATFVAQADTLSVGYQLFCTGVTTIEVGVDAVSMFDTCLPAVEVKPPSPPVDDDTGY